MSELFTVNCPHCQTTVVWQKESQYRPFCSQRCKMIDFGDWADEKQRIAGEPLIDPAETMSDEHNDGLQ